LTFGRAVRVGEARGSLFFQLMELDNVRKYDLAKANGLRHGLDATPSRVEQPAQIETLHNLHEKKIIVICSHFPFPPLRRSSSIFI